MQHTDKALRTAQKRKEYEDEIDKRNREIVEFKRHLNELAPISEIPPELLADIFLQYVSDCENKEDERKLGHTGIDLNKNPDRPYYACRVAHVCHHWREIALSSPRLWSRIVLTDRHDRHKEVWHRSRQAPLFLKAIVNSHREENLDALKLMFSEIYRIYRVYLVLPITMPDSERLLMELLDADAPLLQEVHLEIHVSDLEKCCSPLDPRRDLPRLTRLSINSNRFDYVIPLFRRTLKFLDITISGTQIPPTLSPTQVIATLENMPLLEELKINANVWYNQKAASAQTSIQGTISLPHLRLLRLSLRGISYAYLLDHLSIPSSTSIHIHHQSSGLIGDLHHVATLISGKLTGNVGNHDSQVLPEPLNFVSLDVRNNVMRMRCYSGHGSPSIDPDKFCPKFMFVAPAARGAVQIVQTLCNTLPFSRVRRLLVNDASNLTDFQQTYFTGTTWLNMFRKFHGVQVLAAAGHSVEGLPDILGAKIQSAAGASTEGQSMRLLLPRLRTMVLLSARFRLIPDIPDPQDFLERLLQLLKFRKDNQNILSQLSIRRGVNLGAMQVAQLKDVEVNWDKIETYDYMESEDSEFDSEDEDEGGGEYYGYY